jgi:hypothetical protein
MGNYRYWYVVDKYNVANDLEINDKPFDSGEVQVSLESTPWFVSHESLLNPSKTPTILRTY